MGENSKMSIWANPGIRLGAQWPQGSIQCFSLITLWVNSLLAAPRLFISVHSQSLFGLVTSKVWFSQRRFITIVSFNHYVKKLVSNLVTENSESSKFTSGAVYESEYFNDNLTECIFHTVSFQSAHTPATAVHNSQVWKKKVYLFDNMSVLLRRALHIDRVNLIVQTFQLWLKQMIHAMITMGHEERQPGRWWL